MACFLSLWVVVVGSLTEKYVSFPILIHYFPPNVSPPYAVILVVSVKITTFAKFSFIIATLCVLSGNLVKRIEVCTKYALVLIPFS